VWSPLLRMSELLSSSSFLSSKNKRTHLGDFCSTQFILIGPTDLWLAVRKRLQTPYPAYRTKLRPDTSLNQAFRDLVAKEVYVLLIPKLTNSIKTYPSRSPKNKGLEKREQRHRRNFTYGRGCDVYPSAIVFCSGGRSRHSVGDISAHLRLVFAGAWTFQVSLSFPNLIPSSGPIPLTKSYPRILRTIACAAFADPSGVRIFSALALISHSWEPLLSATSITYAS
jgi:hypothetical protein